MRRAVIARDTRETSIRLKLTIEGRGRYDVSTGIRFFDHMLELVTRHGAFDLSLKVAGATRSPRGSASSITCSSSSRGTARSI